MVRDAMGSRNAKGTCCLISILDVGGVPTHELGSVESRIELFIGG